jgi:glyoxylase-like metal-dependent hydrolase (beta-lactamase superfamily II)
MKRIVMTALALLFAAGTAGAAGVDKLYVIDCGWAHAADQSRWSPGVNVGVPIDVSDNCYLIHHTSGVYLLWDTGITDKVAAMPGGLGGGNAPLTWHRSKTLIAALAEIGVKPEDVKYVAVSHFHPDHTGNVDEFPAATLVIQGAEWDAAMALPTKPFSADHPAMKLAGDKDLFGDGSVTILSTPGHTPGHESLLVHLPKTGYVVLSGDVAHFQSNWDNRRVPGFNFDKDKTLASMERVAQIMKDKNAQLWINHDKPSSDARIHEPNFYD